MVVLPPGVGCWAGNGGGAGPLLPSWRWRSVAASAGPVGASWGGVVYSGGGGGVAAVWAFYIVLVMGGRWWSSVVTVAAWVLLLAGCWRRIAPAAGRGSWASAGRCDGLRGCALAAGAVQLREAVMALCGVWCGGWVHMSRGVPWRRWGPSRGRWGWVWVRGAAWVAGLLRGFSGV